MVKCRPGPNLKISKCRPPPLRSPLKAGGEGRTGGGRGTWDEILEDSIGALVRLHPYRPRPMNSIADLPSYSKDLSMAELGRSFSPQIAFRSMHKQSQESLKSLACHQG